MAAPRHRERDLGWAKIKAEIEALKKSVVKVGVLEAAGLYKPPDGEPPLETIAQVATTHEYGQGRIPQRSFLRAGIDEGEAEIRKTIKGAVAKVAAGEMPAIQALGLVGVFTVAKIQQKIIRGPFKPLAQVTIERREQRINSSRSTKPLVDTGQLHASINYEIADAAAVKGQTRRP